MLQRDLSKETLTVLPRRYETAFIRVSDVNVALVGQSNANVQLVGSSFAVLNVAHQNNSSYIWQR